VLSVHPFTFKHTKELSAAALSARLLTALMLQMT
jgi:hypothetical protein